MIPLFVGTAAVGTTAATAGIIGSAGAVTGAGLATGAALTGSIVGGVMSYQQGKEQEKIAKDQAEQAMTQAEMEAKRIETKNIFEQQQRLKERDLVLGKLRRNIGRSGLTVAGSPLLDELETMGNLTMDIRMAEWNTAEQAKAVRYGGASSASILKRQGASAKRAGYWQAGQSIFSGALAAYSLSAKAPAPSGKWRNPDSWKSGSYTRNFKY